MSYLHIIGGAIRHFIDGREEYSLTYLQFQTNLQGIKFGKNRTTFWKGKRVYLNLNIFTVLRTYRVAFRNIANCAITFLLQSNLYILRFRFIRKSLLLQVLILLIIGSKAPITLTKLCVSLPKFYQLWKNLSLDSMIDWIIQFSS